MSATRDRSSPRSTPQPVAYHHTVDAAVEASDLPGSTDRDVECGTFFENTASTRSGAPSRGTKRLVWIALCFIGAMCLVALGIYYAKHSDKALSNRKDDDEYPSIATLFSIHHSKATNSNLAMHLRQNYVPALPENYMLAHELREQLIQRAAQWRTAYQTNAGNSVVAKYATKAIRITKNVFTTIPSESDQSLMDTGFGIVERTYSSEDLSSFDVYASLKSTFEIKHFYAFYSIFASLDYTNSALTCDQLFGLQIFTSNDYERQLANDIILDLLGCKSNGGSETIGLEMIASVQRSDLYQALVSMFAKAAIFTDNTLVVTSESLNTRFPMWFPTVIQGIEMSMDFKAFAAFMCEKMHHSLYLISPNVRIELLKHNKLQSALQLALLHIHYNFGRGLGSVHTINSQIGEAMYTSSSGVISFEDFIRTIEDGVPVFPGTTTPLLPDAPDIVAPHIAD